ncbi:MAG: hypothetical protein LBR62_00465 [Puniceicoccales bacterium]|jgi:hypothetical protein|nr:hypothetical protein [Puniceicoccales bacterium]
MFVGGLASFPVWMILGLCYVDLWAPWAVEVLVKRSTGFPCFVSSSNISLIKERISLQDILAVNPGKYEMGDFLRVNRIEVCPSIISLFHGYSGYNSIDIDVQKVSWVLNSIEDTNVQTFLESLFTPQDQTKAPQKGSEGKGIFIKQLKLTFNGQIGIRDRSSGLQSKEYPVSYTRSFNNVQYGLTDNQKVALGLLEDSTPLENVLDDLVNTFRSGYGFSALVNTILTSLDKNPRISPFVHRFL